MKKSYIIILVIVLVILGGLYFGGAFEKSEEQKKEEQDLEKNMETVTILETLLSDPLTETTALLPVDGSGSFGNAYRLFKDGKLYHAVIAEMPDPAEGNSYEGWLVRNDPFDFFSTGVMEKKDDQWVLFYMIAEEFPDHSRVVITEETVVDETPEGHIIEGDF